MRYLELTEFLFIPRDGLQKEAEFKQLAEAEVLPNALKLKKIIGFRYLLRLGYSVHS